MTPAEGLIAGKKAADEYWYQLVQQQFDVTDLSQYTTAELLAELDLRENYRIAKEIREIRDNLGLTMVEFGRKLNPIATKGAVCNWEKCRNKPNKKSMQQIKKLAKDGNPR